MTAEIDRIGCCCIKYVTYALRNMLIWTINIFRIAVYVQLPAGIDEPLLEP